MRIRCVLLGLALIGCDKGGDQPAKKPPIDVHVTVGGKHVDEPPGTTRAQGTLTATVDGKPVAMQSAFAWKDGNSVKLWVSNLPSSCEHATARVREIAKGEEDWDAILGRQLQKDGSFGWIVQQVSYGANTRAGGLGATTLTGDASPGAPTTATISFELDSMAFGSQKQEHLKVDGTVDAIGCPPPPPDGSAKPPPPAQAGTMTIAGQQVAIAGAVIEAKPSGDRTIVLSNAGASCNGFAHGDDEDVSLTLHYRAGKDDVWQADLMGRWIDGTQASQIFDKGKLVVTPTAVPAGATTVDLALSGSTDLMGYATAIDGKVTAQVCP